MEILRDQMLILRGEMDILVAEILGVRWRYCGEVDKLLGEMEILG
jgi:hypothetical protein